MNEEYTTMKENNVIDLKNPVEDGLSEFLRDSAQKMLKAAIEQEVQEFIGKYQNDLLDDGRKRLVRNGYLPERNIQTGIGSVEVQVPRVRDRADVAQKITFFPQWIPKYMRRTISLDKLLPLLYLKGISTGDFQTILEPILGKDASNVSHSVIRNLLGMANMRLSSNKIYSTKIMFIGGLMGYTFKLGWKMKSAVYW
jgi:putative transposase